MSKQCIRLIPNLVCIQGDSKLIVQISWRGREYVRKPISNRKVYAQKCACVCRGRCGRTTSSPDHSRCHQCASWRARSKMNRFMYQELADMHLIWGRWRYTSTWAFSQQLGVSQSSMWRILHEERVHLCHLQRVQLLNPTIIQSV